ncbi:UNVERIFIED_CONTAM: hypothetical protein Sradi_0893700 [Sesamum radiatum]|uniref:Uncharacterized protein n=1 Tax=Sesamum radiatum TaxID=300843 RepID=A0AAW2V296_SESRA
MGGYPGGFTSMAATGRYIASLFAANDVGILVAATSRYLASLLAATDSSGCTDEAEGV